MPPLSEIIARLAFLTTAPAVVGLVVTASLIILLQDWRIALTALLAQYLLTGFLLTRLITPEVATVKTLVGALVGLILYLTARRSPRNRAETPGSLIGQEALSVPFRLLAVILTGLAVNSLLHSYPPPEAPKDISFACYWLTLMGLLAMILTPEPWKAGLGLLTFMTGFELFYAALESSLSVMGFLEIINLFMALAIAYLVTLGEAEWTGEQSP